MSKSYSIQYSVSPFDPIRKFNDNGSEFWSARDLMPILGYQAWHRFEDAIDRAKYSCQSAGNVVTEHFTTEALKTISAGRPSEDCNLTRYGAYLVAMNGDPRKPEIAAAQTYFAIKTREAETCQPQSTDPLTLLKESNRTLEIQLAIAQTNLESLKIEKGLIAVLPSKAHPKTRTKKAFTPRLYVPKVPADLALLSDAEVEYAIQRIELKVLRTANPISIRDLYRNIAEVRNLATKYSFEVNELTLNLCRKVADRDSCSLIQEQREKGLMIFLKAK